MSMPRLLRMATSTPAFLSQRANLEIRSGGVGVNQAMNAAVLTKSTSASTATAYSLSQQLVVTTWDIAFAVVLVSWVFGWTGGHELVRSSYAEAKVRGAELKDQRRTRRTAGQAS